MDHLTRQMMLWFSITEERLIAEGEIDTPIDRMTWDYVSYIRAHPVVSWSIPTAILYGARDTMQTRELMQDFSQRHNCALTVSENSEHPFIAQSDHAIVTRWLRENI